MLIRAVQVLDEHTEILNTSATPLVPQVKAVITSVNTLYAHQVTGNGGKRGAVSDQRAIAKGLRQTLRDITATARVLAKKAAHPGLADELHFPLGRSYAALLAAADSFVEVLGTGTLKTQFVARGFAATFLEDLTAQAAAFRAANERKYGGLGKQVQNTAAIGKAIRDGIAIIRDLDAILSPQLRKTDLALYNRWKGAIHIETRTRKKKATKAKAVKASAGAGAATSAGTPVTTPAPVVP